jgi:hypothetical protein
LVYKPTFCKRAFGEDNKNDIDKLLLELDSLYTNEFWPRVRSRALRAFIFLINRQRGAVRTPPPHLSFADPSGDIYDI